MVGGLVSVTRLPHRQSSRYDVPERAPAIATKRELLAQQPEWIRATWVETPATACASASHVRAPVSEGG